MSPDSKTERLGQEEQDPQESQELLQVEALRFAVLKLRVHERRMKE